MADVLSQDDIDKLLTGVAIANGEVVVIDDCFGIRICEMAAKAAR